jgi:hypothetical protein
MPDPINPQFLRIYRVPKPTLEGGELLHSKPIPHTQVALYRIDLATGLVEDATRTSNGLPLPKISRPTHHHHIIERHKNIFATVALDAHGGSLLGGLAKVATLVDRSSYLARAIDKLLLPHTSSRNQPETQRADNTSRPIDTMTLPTLTIVPISPTFSQL